MKGFTLSYLEKQQKEGLIVTFEIPGESKSEKKKRTVSTSSLKAKAIKVFNAWIRKRDDGEPCISCGNYRTLQAGHFYSAGHHTHMRFMELNVNGQCLQCNYHLSGNLIEYRKNLIKKIGIEEIEKLDQIAAVKTMTKDNRFYFEEIILKYKI